MLRLFALLCAFFMMAFTPEAKGAESASKLNWMTNFEEASLKAKKEKKALLLFFTGSDWCGWCHKLENEALDTTDFSDAVGDRFIFVVVDFPLRTPLDATLTAQNKELQRKFDVKGFPTVILLDENGGLIGSTGYKPGGGHSYAEHLKKMVQDFKGYKQKVSKSNGDKLETKELESLYGKAKELCREEDRRRIVKWGLQKKDNHFFLLERLRLLANEGQIHTPEARNMREQLLKQDPDNRHKTHYEVAIIEFEAYSELMEKENYSADTVVQPLVDYVERFKDHDNETIWQLQMIIAQVFLDKNRYTEALKHAKDSHASAPESIQPDIQRFIVNIQR